MTQNEPGGIVALTAQTQQILVQALRQIEFAAVHVITGLPIGNVKELRGKIELLPQLSGAGVGLARFRRRVAFDGSQHRAQGAVKFELLSLTFGVVRQQRQLIQSLLKLRGRFRHRRAGDGPLAGLSPISDGFFNEPGLGVMLREELRLSVHQLGGMSFECLGDLRVQLLASAAQQAAVCRVLHQRVLEAIDRFGRCAALEHQLGSDEASESGLQLVLGKTGDGMQQLV